MTARAEAMTVVLPSHWSRRVRSAVVHAASMARVAFTAAHTHAEHHAHPRARLQANNDRLEREVALLREELRIKDARMEKLTAQQRPHYPPEERLAILELRAARGWSRAETARRMLVTPLTIASWTHRLPETHATRAFAKRHAGRVYLNFFNENQRGSAAWNSGERIVQINRTEALDASRAAVRDKLITLPRRDRLVEQFAQHMSADAKVLDEDEETGVKRYRYIKTGTNHFSLAFTYAWMAVDRVYTGSCVVVGSDPLERNILNMQF